jgi:hypothetical protein
MVPAELLADIAELRKQGYDVEEPVDLPSEALVVFPSFNLPAGLYNMPQCRVLIRVSAGYPNAALDMFYTQPDLALANGAPARQSEVLEELSGKVWRRFSWHRNAEWKPGRDSLVSFISFIEDRLGRDQ